MKKVLEKIYEAHNAGYLSIVAIEPKLSEENGNVLKRVIVNLGVKEDINSDFNIGIIGKLQITYKMDEHIDKCKCLL